MATAKLPERSAFPPKAEVKKEPSEKKVEKVIKGNVTTRKKSLGKKFSDTFLGDDINNVKGYIFFDVLIPAVKDTISNVISNGVEMLLFGEPKSTGKRRDGAYTSYSNYYSNKNERRSIPKSTGSHNFRDIILETRGEAEEVLSNLVDIVYDYGSASVSDLYDLVGITGNFTDNKYGWTDLSGCRVNRARGGGFIIDLPRVEKLD